MKTKRLICSLLVLCLLGSFFFGSAPIVSACEEGALYGDDWTFVGVHGTINRDVTVLNVETGEKVKLNKDCRVYVKEKFWSDGDFYIVSFGSYGTFTDVPVDAVTLEGEKLPIEEEPSGDMIGKHGIINRDVMVLNLRKNKMEQLNKDCRVYVEKKFWDEEYFYIVSFGSYGVFTRVPVSAVTLEGEKAPSEPEPPVEPEPPADTNPSREPIGEHGTINREVTVSRKLANGKLEKVKLNKGCRVYVKEKFWSDGYFYVVSFGSYGTFTDVPVDAVTFECEKAPSETEPPADAEPPADTNPPREPIGKHGTINRDVMVSRKLANGKLEKVKLNKGCVVYVKELVFEGECYYNISFGSYGNFTKVPIDAITLGCVRNPVRVSLTLNVYWELHMY